MNSEKFFELLKAHLKEMNMTVPESSFLSNTFCHPWYKARPALLAAIREAEQETGKILLDPKERLPLKYFPFRFFNVLTIAGYFADQKPENDFIDKINSEIAALPTFDFTVKNYNMFGCLAANLAYYCGLSAQGMKERMVKDTFLRLRSYEKSWTLPLFYVEEDLRYCLPLEKDVPRVVTAEFLQNLPDGCLVEDALQAIIRPYRKY